MYIIKAVVDGKEYTIHDPSYNDAIVGKDAYFEIGDNKNGQAEFIVYPNNPYYSVVKKLTTDIIIYNNKAPCFYGRVLYDDEDASGAKHVFVEGELAFLCDSVQRPAVYHDISVIDYFSKIISLHNSQVEERKQFVVGRVSVTDSNDSLYRYSNWETTRETLTEKLVKRLGGHLRIRHENGQRIIDYLSDEEFNTTCKQQIRFGENLLDYSKNMDASDLATCIIPLGARKDESSIEGLEERVTISDVNGGVDYVMDDDAVAEYGKIYKTVTWDDVTEPANLLKKAQKYLTTTQYEKMVLEVKAVDLSLTSSDVEEMKIGQMVRCISKPRSMDVYLPLAEKKVYIQDFGRNTVTLGSETSAHTYTSTNASQSASIEETIKDIPSRGELLQAALRQATNLLNDMTQSGYAIHTKNEFIVADAEGATTARRLWRWGLGGLAHYSEGYDGPADGVAITMDGKINGKMLIAGSVMAETIDASYRQDVEESISDAKSEAESTSKGYTDDSISTVTKQTETKLNNLNNQITMSVESVRESVLQKNYIVKGEQDTLALDAFSVTGDFADISIAEHANMRCLKLAFKASGIVYINQDVGTLAAGNYKVSVATAYPEGDGTRPKYIAYGFSSSRETAYFADHAAGNFFRLNLGYKITEAEKTVSIGVYGDSGNVCYLTDIRCLRSIDELLDDVYTAFTVADGNIRAEVQKTYATNKDIESLKNNVNDAQSKADEAADAVVSARKEAQTAQEAADKAKADAAAAAQAAADAEANAAEDASAKAEAARKAAEEAAAKQSAADAAAAKLAAAEDASAKADAALANAKDYTNAQLKNYSTTEEMRSAINQSAEKITAEVSKTYTTKSELGAVENKVSDAQKSADDANAAVAAAKADAASAQEAADKAKADAAAAAQAAADAEANAAEDASAKAEAARKAAEEAAAKQSAADAAAAKLAAAEDASAKADAALANAKDYLNQTLLSYSTTEETKSLITQSAESIKSEVSRTYVTTATVEQAKKDATSDAQSYTDGKLASYSTTEETKSLIQQTADSITQTVEKKLIGGGNLILNTEKMENAVVRGSGGSVAYSVDGSATVTNNASNTYFRFKTVDTTITKGMVMCFSVLYKPVSGTRSLCFSIYFKKNGSNYYTSITDANQREIPQTDGWVLRYGTWVPTGNSTLQYVDFGCGSNVAGDGKYTESSVFLHPMLQHGNTPTAWNASSGDYLTQESAKSLFSQTADEIKTEVTNSVTESVTANVKDTATSAANDAVDGKMQDYATSADVELLKESVSSISQKADSITQTVTQRITGGNNIITGTDDWNNATLDAGGNDLSKKGTYTISGESVRVTNKAQNTRFHFGADKTLVIAKGMTYCASVLYKLNSGTDSLFLQFETKNSSGAKSYYGSAFKQAQRDIALDNGWKLRWAAFTATADGYADGLFVSTANDNATVTNDLTIMHPMVQMGNTPTAWTASTGDYLTANETKTEIKQTFDTIKLTASTSGTSSTIKLTAGGTEITSAQINLSGVVTFSDLSTWNQDKTIINGGNITTGQLHNLKYNTVYDLDNAWIRMGTEAGERVYIDNRHIAWYATINTGSIGLTGVLYSEAGSSYIGACSKYAKYGWVDGLDPTSYVGMQITYNRSDDSDADFNTSRVGVSGTLNCQNLSAWGSKSRVVSTSFGATKMAALETPIPMFSDVGFGECGPDGWCLIMPDPRYAETIAQNGRLIWMLTDCTGNGHLWVEDLGRYAIVHGAAGQRFSWMVVSAQRGYEGEYAEPSDCNYPSGTPAGADYAASEAARAFDRDTEAADALLGVDTETDSLIDTLLEETEE